MKNIDGVIEHLKMHQKYPATKEELVAECDELSDFDAEDKKWFVDHLPSGLYKSAGEVMMALKIDAK